MQKILHVQGNPGLIESECRHTRHHLERISNTWFFSFHPDADLCACFLIFFHIHTQTYKHIIFHQAFSLPELRGSGLPQCLEARNVGAHKICEGLRRVYNKALAKDHPFRRVSWCGLCAQVASSKPLLERLSLRNHIRAVRVEGDNRNESTN